MFEALKARGRALTNGKARRTGAGRGKAAVSFAARLTFDDLSRRYGATLALDHVSLDIARRNPLPARAFWLRQVHIAQDRGRRRAAKRRPRSSRRAGGGGA
jgi:hypothetical protein